MVHVLVYKGYRTHIEYDNQDEVYYGKIEGISDLVLFESHTLENCKIEFENAVEDYLNFCYEMHKIPMKDCYLSGLKITLKREEDKQ